MADVEAELRTRIPRITGCSRLDVQAIPGRNARVEITLTLDQAMALVRYLDEQQETIDTLSSDLIEANSR